MANDVVYHYANTTHLPWILEVHELRPEPNNAGGYPIDFLWATTNPKGSRSSSAFANKESLRAGHTRLVRFTLPASAFVTWPGIVERFPQWTPDHVNRLEDAARKLGDDDSDSWRCRAEPLALTPDTVIETKSYTGEWSPLDSAAPVFVAGLDEVRGAIIDGMVYFSMRGAAPDGRTIYMVRPPVPYDEIVGESEATFEFAKDAEGQVVPRRVGGGTLA
jgi:hypothetical protein